MILFADTNWLEALYLEPNAGDQAAMARAATATRRMQKHHGTLTTSHIVLLEARNVFSRVTGNARPQEWSDLISDFNGKVFVDPMDWDLLRQEATRLFERFSHKGVVGSFDTAIVASALLAGAREFLSFDERIKAVAKAAGLEVFPKLSGEGLQFLSKLKRDADAAR